MEGSFSLDEMSEKVGGRFHLVSLVQHRIREIKNGAPVLTDVEHELLIDTVCKEIMEDCVSYEEANGGEEMEKKPNQMETGKAFEYAILSEFYDKLSRLTTVKVVNNDAYKVTRKAFGVFDKQEQGKYLLTASFAVNFLMDIEPRLSHDIGKNDILNLEILSDNAGESGDVRDVLAIRKAQDWEIGVSAKNNHKAVKHPRLSDKINFGEKWIGVSASSEYFDAINPVFAKVKEYKNKGLEWSELENKETEVYLPILYAFKKEIEKIYKANPLETAQKLVEYLVGNRDFYKVIKTNSDEVEIHAYNLYGTLNLSFKEVEPKLEMPQIELPNKILDISFKKNSKTTLVMEFNNEWAMSFRIHNASTKVEPSLKFDVTLLSSPKSLFKNTLSTI